VIDLHCHILPGIDDGAQDMDTSLKMAKIAVEDGIKTLACTPHIYQGIYDNNSKLIKDATAQLQKKLDHEGIKLKLTFASDTHIHPDLVQHLKNKKVPTFRGGRYFLLEPSHHQKPLFLEEHIDQLLMAGFVPVMTHPERLTYIADSFNLYTRLIHKGVWIQITASSLTGHFGKNARYWAERFLNEGKVHIIASDAHSIHRRPPILSLGLEVAKRALGEIEAMKLVLDRPEAILNNADPEDVDPIPFIGNPSLWRPLKWRLGQIFTGSH